MTDKPVTIASIMWASYLPTFFEAAENHPHVRLAMFSQKEIVSNADMLDAFFKAAEKADVLFFYWTNDEFWAEVEQRLPDMAAGKTVVTASFDPTHWGRLSTVPMETCAKAYAYMNDGGLENYRRLLSYLSGTVNPDITAEDPVPLPWQGILHPPGKEVYDTVASYRKAFPSNGGPTVGLLFSRHSFTNSDAGLESALIEALQKQGLAVLPVFCNGTPDIEAGSLGPIGTAERFFFDETGKSRISALVNLHFFFLGRERGEDTSETGVAAQSVALFKKLDVPVFKPFVSYSKSAAEWEEDPQGVTADVCFGIAMPEFEGNIEPLLMACSRKVEDTVSGSVYEIRDIIEERVHRIAERIARWVRLSRKTPEERRAVLVLHKNECAGLEASVGGAGGLDTGESVVRIMRALRDEGYRLENIPETGEDLMQLILERKAIAEFRWTTVDEIVEKNGHLMLLENSVYQSWFDALPEKAKRELVESWGHPPGEELNGVPPSMVYQGKLVITGLAFGNVFVMMQPKRGCAGARCDGQVCKILHDPDIPPPHQYIATYMAMDRVLGADVVIHVGTHGNLEWMPGKGAGLSASCWPDIAIGSMPHLYIYNSDNPAEGVVAKRRGHATLVNHLQAMMTVSDTYEGLKDLEELLADYRKAADDPARAHQLEHLIREKMAENHLENELDDVDHGDFKALAERCHEILSSVKNSQTRIGMHVFGEIPENENLYEVINTILRFDSAAEFNTRRLVFDFWNENLSLALAQPGKASANGKTYGELLFDADRKAVDLIERIIDGWDGDRLIREEFGDGPFPESLAARFHGFADLVIHVARRIESSREIPALLHAMDGGHVPAGPSGFISRGRYDILPTGRNMYNVDPTRIPTEAAWRVGVRLAEALLSRYLREEGGYPESVGMVWLASDIMRADGEQIGQILHLLGVKPRWKANGQVDGFTVIPSEELGRPRVDVNVRVSGITRDCFPDAVRYIDQAVTAVALLKEKPESNFIRKHIMDHAARDNVSIDDPAQFRRLSYRVFSAKPGVYKAGVNLAVQASAWKTENDLTDVYLYWNGFAYGEGMDDFGVPAHGELMENLKRVRVTFDKHISDEADFLNCCGFFGNYGGMTVAAKTLSGKKPKTYYGDTRDPAHVSVTDFADELRRVVRTKLLNPKYIEGMKQHGYKGAGDLSKRIGRVYGFGATTGEVDDWIFDEIAETFVLDEAMRQWFGEVNPWAMEEIGRRLLEAEGRGIWKPSEELLSRLKEAYLDTESLLEDRMGDVHGDFQGGAVDVMSMEDVEAWATEWGMKK